MDLTVISDLGDQLGDFDAGPYPERPRTALVVPIAMVPGAATASGFLVAGVSARRTLDDGYRTFFKMLQEAVGIVLTAARARELERARTEALAELDRAKTLFFSNVSHEFRTPLTLMLGPLEDLLGDDDVPDETQGMLRLIHRNGLRLMRLVVSLLDFSRIEAGRIEALFEPIDLDVLTADVASNFESACERAGLRLIIDCPAIGEPVYVDRQMWEKVILNLVANAFKYTLDGEIEVRLRSSHGSVALTVRDTGVGIADEHQERVFDRFQRVEGARGRTQEGTGIGLALVRELVRMHGGSINVSSQVGVGSTFTVELPLGSEHLPPERVRHESSFGPTRVDSSPFVEEALAWLPDVVSAPAPSDEQAPTVETDARILVADDNADMRRYLSSLLSEHWRVKLVSDGAAAVASAVEDPPDLILADVMMPVIDGLEMVEHLRANPRTQAVPIMLLSARAGEDSRIEGLDVGADDYLVKPFSARELVARVAARLGIASKATEARIVVEGERARLYHAFMEAPIPVAILRGEELICEMANPAALEVFGWADPVGRPILEAMPGLRDHGIDRLLHGVLQRGRTVVGREVLVRVDDPKGSREEYFDVIYEPLTDLDDRIDGIMVVASAVTAEVHARERVERALQRQAELNAVLRERQEELRLANRAKDEFLSLMSHELKTPITTIYGGAVMLESNGDELDPDTRHSLIADIQTESERLHRIIEDLLVLARGQHADAEAEPILVPRLVRKLVDDHQQRWPERHVEIIDQEPDAIVIARPTYFEQVIRNLMSNAEKYSPSDQPITIAIDRDSDMVSVEVRDRGIGLDDDELEQLFTPFYRSERAARQASGIGLGLVVCKRVIESHGGRVWASRRDGGGAAIGLTLPLADQDFDAEPDQGRDVDDRSPMVDRSNVSLGSAPGSR